MHSDERVAEQDGERWRVRNASAKNSICKQILSELFNYLRYCKMVAGKFSAAR